LCPDLRAIRYTGDAMAKSQEIVGTVKRVFFEKNNFVIASLQDGPDIKGSAAAGDIKEQLTYRFFGTVSKHEKFGEQFLFSSFAIDMPHERDGVMVYLKKEATGVGVVAAGKLWDKFGSEAVDVLIRDPDRAVKEGCISEKVAKAASESLKVKVENQKTRIDLLSLFNGLGFPGQLIPALIKKWGVKAPEIVREDPFRMLLEEMPGCGFARVDHLHNTLGHPHTSPRRQMVLAWSKVQENNDGHTWLSESDVAYRVSEAMGSDGDPVLGIRHATQCSPPLLVRRAGAESYLALPSRSEAEEKIVRGLARLMACPVEHWPDANTLGEIDDHQRAAATIVLNSPVGILTGTPGTGKTFTSAQIIKATIKNVPPCEIAVCAPTGKASVRITKAMHEYGLKIEATTIHRLLGIAGQTRDGFRFEHDATNPLSQKVIVVDEMSMTDTDLMGSLIDAIAPGAHLLMIGDPYQLPPVGHGAPLRDLIDAGVPTGELSEIRRNSGLIVTACRDIKNGWRYATCDKFDDEGNNFRSIEADKPATVLANLRTICQKLKERGATDTTFDPIEDVQVLCVVNAQSELGRFNLNRILQEELNSHGEGGDQHPFRVNDKVICLNNKSMPVMEILPGAKSNEFDAYFITSAERKERYVANGDMGRVLAISPNKLIVRFNHPERVVVVALPGAGKPLPAGGGDEGRDAVSYGPVDLGYAVTTHKSQGSEWHYVIIPIDESDRARRVVSRELLYTAISRAKKRCILLGRRSIADEWCQTVVMRKRKTFLKELTQAKLADVKTPPRAAAVEAICDAAYFS
jgi:exodeoxyribonuclease V alpha subunit